MLHFGTTELRRLTHVRGNGITFYWKSCQELRPAAIRDLATGLFIELREHVLLNGTAITGKSHFTQAMRHHDCCSGRLVLILKAVKLLRTLASRDDNSWDAELRRLLAPDLHIIDNFVPKPIPSPRPMTYLRCAQFGWMPVVSIAKAVRLY